MLQGRTFQIKMVKDETPKFLTTHDPNAPKNSPESIALEVATTVTGCAVVGYTVCKSVNFFFKMAEHVIVNR